MPLVCGAKPGNWYGADGETGDRCAVVDHNSAYLPENGATLADAPVTAGGAFGVSNANWIESARIRSDSACGLPRCSRIGNKFKIG